MIGATGQLLRVRLRKSAMASTITSMVRRCRFLPTPLAGPATRLGRTMALPSIAPGTAAPEPAYLGVMVLMLGMLALVSYLRKHRLTTGKGPLERGRLRTPGMTPR